MIANAGQKTGQKQNHHFVVKTHTLAFHTAATFLCLLCALLLNMEGHVISPIHRGTECQNARIVAKEH